MRINPNNVEILISAVGRDQYPNTGLPEIALSGRSNVGKSSFINAVAGRKNIARTSSKPGKTQTLNFYNMDDQFIFVDVPGYGYAKQSKKSRAGHLMPFPCLAHCRRHQSRLQQEECEMPDADH